MKLINFDELNVQECPSQELSCLCCKGNRSVLTSIFVDSFNLLGERNKLIVECPVCKGVGKYTVALSQWYSDAKLTEWVNEKWKNFIHPLEEKFRREDGSVLVPSYNYYLTLSEIESLLK